MKRRDLVTLALAAACWVALGTPRSGNCQVAGRGSAEPVSGERPLLYRQVYVPSEKLPEVARGYLPISRAEFDRLLGEIGRRAGTPSAALARIEHVESTARFDPPRTLRGQAVVRISHHDDRPVLVSLADWGPAVGGATWGAPDGPAATLGVGPAGRQVVRVPQAGQLILDWSLRGAVNQDGSVVFPIVMPACPDGRLKLELPGDLTPRVDRPVVATPAPSDAGSNKEPAADGTATRPWLIRFGGQSQWTLTLAAEPAGGAEPPAPALRERSAYRFTHGGVELLATLHLDVGDRPLHRLALEVDSRLKLIDARVGDRPVHWTPAAAVDEATETVVLGFEDPLRGAGRVVQLRCFAPVRFDQLERLPRVVASDVVWQEGAAELVVPAPLVVQHVTTEGCTLADTTALPAPDRGRSLMVRFHQPDARIDLAVAHEAPQATAATGTSVRLAQSGTTADTVVDLAGVRGHTHEVVARIDPAWVVDAVQSVAVEAWHVAFDANDEGRLYVRLAESLKPGQNVRLRIRGHRRETLLGSLIEPQHLVMLRFEGVAVAERLVAVRTEGPYRTEVSNDDDVRWVDTAELATDQLERLGDDSGSVVFARSDDADGLRLLSHREQPQYNVSIDVDAHAQDDQLTQEFRIHCDPVSSYVGRLRVHLAHARDADVRWSIGSEGDRALIARRVDASRSSATADAAAGQDWEITLRRPRNVPFVLIGRQRVDWAAATPVTLAALPEATTQRGNVTLRSSGECQAAIENHDLTPTTSEPFATNRYTDVLAVYRYEPSRDALVATRPPLVLSPVPDQQRRPTAWAWLCHVRSRFSQDGTSAHSATYRLQNNGTRKLVVKLPADVRLRSVALDGKPVVFQQQADRPIHVDVELAAGRKYPTLVVQFERDAAPLRAIASVRSVVPELSVPVLDARWSVWLPPEYAPLRSPPCGAVAELGWRRRLFGPLGQRHGDRPVNVLSADDWLAPVQAAEKHTKQRAATQRLLNHLRDQATRLRSQSDAGRPTWGQLLIAVAEEDARNGGDRPLLIDAVALEAVDLWPSTRTTIAAKGPLDAASLLSDEQLVLLVHRDALILTSEPWLAACREHLEPLPRFPAMLPATALMRGQIAEQIHDATWIMPPGDWSAGPRRPANPWIGRPASSPTTVTTGWNVTHLEIDGPTPVLSVCRPNLVRLLGYAAMLMAAGLSWSMAARRLGWLIGLGGGALVASVLLPAALVPPAWGVTLGLMLGGGARWAWRYRANGATAANGGPTASPSTTAAVGVAVFVAAAFWCLTSAPAQRSRTPSGESGTHTVFVRIDEQRQPIDDYLHVSPQFYKEINHRAETAAGADPDWLLGGIEYTGELQWRQDQSTLAAGPITASCRVRTFRADTVLELPWGDVVDRTGGSIVVDGRTVTAADMPQQQVLGVAISQPGEHRVEVRLVPEVFSEETADGYRLRTPPVSQSRLRLSTPSGVSDVSVPSARGRVSFDGSQLRVNADLGAATQLAVQWPRLGVESSSPLRLEQLTWLNVRPDSVTLEARLKLEAADGARRPLRLRLDPRLQLVLPPEQQVVRRTRIVSERPRVVELELNDDVELPTTLALSFALADSSGIGVLRTPTIEVVDAVTSVRWLALSLERGLTAEAMFGDSAESLTVDRFAQAWGATETPPQFAFRLLQPETTGRIAVRVRPPAITVGPETVVRCGRDFTAVRWHADVQIDEGYVIRHRLTTPAAARITRVAARTGDGTLPIRWARDDGKLSIFFDQPTTGAHRLTIEADIPTAEQMQLPLPRIELLGASTENGRWLIARQHDVLVDVDQIEGLTPTDPPATNDRKVEQGRLVAALTAADAEPSAVLRLTPNEPRLHGTLATRFTREADGWYLTVDGRLDALDGPIDRLRFDVPAAWADALDEDAGVSCHPGALPDHTRKRLTVWLSEAATGPFQVELRGRVATAAGQRVEAPNVRLLDGDEVRQILILPTRAETQQIAWETRYLRSSELPEPFLSESGSQRGLACYEVMLPRYRAVLQSVQTASGVPQVRLADMRITWRDNRRVFGRAAFDLEPAGLTHCYVEMPEGCQPLWSSAAELPGDLQPRGERLWLLSLHTEQLPQRIEIVFSGRIGDDAPRGHEIAFEAPTLRDAQMLPLPVERTLWTIWGPAAAGHGAPVEGGAVVDPLRQQMYRLRSTAALIDLASSVVTDHAAVEVQRWYVPWARRMIEAHRAAARLTPRDDATLSEGERILQQQATIAQRLGTSQSLAEMLRQPAAGGEPAGVHVTAAASSRPPVRCMYRGAAGRLVVRYPDAPQGNLAWRLATAVALLIGTVAACPVWVRSWCGERCRRWPHAAGVLIGVASWLLLWPSLFGWAIIVVCLAASLRTGRRVAGSGEGSTMLRSVEPPQS